MLRKAQRLHPARVLMLVWSLITMTVLTEQLCTDTIVLSVCTSLGHHVYLMQTCMSAL